MESRVCSPCRCKVRNASALPKGYVGRWWVTPSASLGEVFHFYAAATDDG